MSSRRIDWYGIVMYKAWRKQDGMEDYGSRYPGKEKTERPHITRLHGGNTNKLFGRRCFGIKDSYSLLIADF